MPRPPQPLLSREAIARSALAVIDEEGPEALTVRRIAARLGVRAQSLYNHVRSKDDILNAVTELIDGTIDPPPEQAADWREALLVFARGYRRAFLRHRRAGIVIAARPVETDVARGYYDRVLRLLTGAGWAPGQAMEIVLAVDYLVLGSVVAPFTAGFVAAPEAYQPHATLAAAVAAADPATVDDAAFERALTGFVASLGDRS